jgi:hypothetical protein
MERVKVKIFDKIKLRQKACVAPDVSIRRG